MSALTKIKQSGFMVTLVDGYIEISPSSKLTPLQREFLKQHKAAIVTQLEAETLSLDDKQKILAWLDHIGETDQELIDDVLAQVTNDKSALAYFIKRAEDVTQPIALIQCGNCTHFKSIHDHGKGRGICKTGVQSPGVNWWSATQHQCDNYSNKIN